MTTINPLLEPFYGPTMKILTITLILLKNSHTIGFTAPRENRIITFLRAEISRITAHIRHLPITSIIDLLQFLHFFQIINSNRTFIFVRASQQLSIFVIQRVSAYLWAGHTLNRLTLSDIP